MVWNHVSLGKRLMPLQMKEVYPPTAPLLTLIQKVPLSKLKQAVLWGKL